MVNLMKKILFILMLLFPSFIKVFLLRLMGHDIGKNVHIGFSYIESDLIIINDNASIGGFNVIKGLKEFALGESSTIGKLNVITANAYYRNKYEEGGILRIGQNSAITMRHYIDVQEKILIGDKSLIAGIGTLMFTHQKGSLDLNEAKAIHIGDNVYLGAACRIMPGTEINNNCIVAAGSILAGKYNEEFSLIAGEKAKIKKILDNDHSYFESKDPAGPNR